MKRFKTIICLVFTLGYISLSGQDQDIQLDLKQVLEFAGTRSIHIQYIQTQQVLAKAEYQQAKSWWIPDVYGGFSTHQLNGTTINGDGRFFLDVNRQSFSAALGLNLHWNLNQGVFGSKAAKLKSASISYQSQAEKNQAILKIIRTYYELLFHTQKEKSLKDLIIQSDTIALQLQSKVDAGLTMESDYLLAASNTYHLKHEHLEAERMSVRLQSQLLQLLNFPMSTNLLLQDSLLTLLQPLQINADKSLAQRPELEQLDYLERATKQNQKSAQWGFLLPEFQVGAYASYFGDLFAPTYPTRSLNAALTWKFPLGHILYGGQRNEVLAKLNQIKLRKALIEQDIQQEIYESDANIVLSKRQVDSAKEGLLLAARALDQAIQKQALNIGQPYELLQAQEMYLKLSLDYMRSIIDHNISQYERFVAMGGLL